MSGHDLDGTRFRARASGSSVGRPVPKLLDRKPARAIRQMKDIEKRDARAARWPPAAPPARQQPSTRT